MSLVLALVVLGGLVLYGGAVWFGLDRSWANRPAFLSYPILGLPWAALAILVLAIPRFVNRWLGLPFPAVVFTLQDFLCLALVAIALTVSFLGWPGWALPPWFRRQEQERHGVAQQELAVSVHGTIDETRELSPWRRWRLVAVGVSLTILVITLSVVISHGPIDWFGVGLSLFVSVLGGGAFVLDFKRNEARYRAHGWRW